MLGNPKFYHCLQSVWKRRNEVYSATGEFLKTYEGKLDIETNEYGNKVLFDMDGKRTIIHNATVIVKEK